MPRPARPLVSAPAQTLAQTLALALILAAPLAVAPARAETGEADLRTLRVGGPADALPAEGYDGFACRDGTPLEGWSGYRRCPAAADGSRAVRFRYRDGGTDLAFVNGTYEGTKVGGHPVVLEVEVAPDGRVAALRIETDSEARLRQRRRAHLLGELARARYGAEGWTCEAAAAPAAGEEAVGGLFVDERCAKATPTRRYRVERRMLRPAGAAREVFVSRSLVEIRPAE